MITARSIRARIHRWRRGPDHQIGMLWVGGALSYLEQLCMVSLMRAGHSVRLYTYDPVTHVPDGVELGRADDILPHTHLLRHQGTGSLALHSDVFRAHLLARSDRTIWADCDAYCVRAFRPTSGHFFAWEFPGSVNSGVLGLPPDSETLGALIEFMRDEWGIPPWIEGEERAAMQAARDAGNPVHVTKMRWGVWGPHALTHFLHQTGEIRQVLPQATLYPFSYPDRRMMTKPKADLSAHITRDTQSIHFYGHWMRERLIASGGRPRPGSLIGRLLRQHGINPADAPLPAMHIGTGSA